MSEEPAPTDGSFVYWPEITGLHVVRKNVGMINESTGKKYIYDWCDAKITYKGKIKLHGNNGGIDISETEGAYNVVAQSRSKALSVNDDLNGFAKWTAAHKNALVDFRKKVKETYNTERTMLFGEWCGTGIQRNVSVCQINKKIFAVFSVWIDGGLISDPAIIRSFFGETLPEDLHIIPWMVSAECGDAILLNYESDEILEAEVVKINSLIERIDNIDPWILEVFKVEGPGEGVVWYPVSLEKDNLISVEGFERFSFKAKGAKHAVVKTAKPVQIKPEKAENVSEFVDNFVTEGRCEQGVGKVVPDGAAPTKALVSKFIEWMVGDVKKESTTELEASNLQWKQVDKEIANAARKWYLSFVEKQEKENKGRV